MSANIHERAIVQQGAELGNDVEIGPYAIIGPKVKIGNGTKVLAHAIVEGDTQIGENNTIGHYAIVGGPPQDLKYNGELTKLVVGDNNDIREYVTINAGTAQDKAVTVIGNNNFLLAYSHVGHDTVLMDNIVVVNSTNIGGHVVVEDWVTFTGNVGVCPFVRVGKHAYIGAHTVLDKDVAPYCAVMGYRGEVRGVNLVGLKRRGFAADRIRSIQAAHKVYFDSDKEKAEALSEVEALFSEQQDVSDFVSFIRASEKGITQ